MNQPKDYAIDIEARTRIDHTEHELPPRWLAYLVLGVVIGIALTLGFLTGFCA